MKRKLPRKDIDENFRAALSCSGTSQHGSVKKKWVIRYHLSTHQQEI